MAIPLHGSIEMKILLVDDDDSTLTMLRMELARGKCQVTAASDAESALKALAEVRYDWLIVDGQIPPFSGFQLAEKAKEIQPNLKIAMISGVYESADIVGTPIGRLFQKPVDTDALTAYLQA